MVPGGLWGLGEGCAGLRWALHCRLLWLLVTWRILGGVLLRCLVWVGLVVCLLSRILSVRIRILRIVIRHGCVVALRDRYSDGFVKTIGEYKGSLCHRPLKAFFIFLKMRQSISNDMGTRVGLRYRSLPKPTRSRFELE